MGTEQDPTQRRPAPESVATRSGRTERLVVALVTLGTVLLGAVWALTVPMFQAPDESAHLDSAMHLALGDAWVAPARERLLTAVVSAVDSAPATTPTDRPTWGALLAADPGESRTVDQMTQHPPTYYLIAAGVLRAIGFEGVRWDVSVVVLRLLGVAMVAPVPAFVWMTIRRLTRSPRLAVVGAVAVLAVAQLMHIGASVSNDPPVVLLGAVLAWLAARVMTGERRWPTLVGMGLTLAGLAWFKGTGLTAIPFATVVVLAGAVVPQAGRVAFRRRLVDAAVVLGVAAIAGAWWWVRNLVVDGELQPDGLRRQVVPWPHGTGRDLGYFVNNDWSLLTRSFWGDFGKLQFPMSPILTTLLSFACLLGVVVAVSGGRWRRASIVLAVLPVVVGAIVVETNWSAYGKLQQIAAAQGRYFFVALVPLVVLAALGWRRMLTPGSVLTRRFGIAVAIAAPAIGIYGLSVAYRGFYQGATTSVTRAGLAHLAATTPLGRGTLVVVGVLAVLALVAAAVAVVRFVRADSPTDRPTSGSRPVH